MIYGTRSNGRQHGVVLTRSEVVEAMLDRVGYTADRDLRAIRVVEPAAGTGAFAVAIIDRLYRSSQVFGFAFQEALQCLCLYEIDPAMSEVLRQRLTDKLAACAAQLPSGLIQTQDFLLGDAAACDLVIGNPPYVRHEQIPAAQKQVYRRRFSTFAHRSDLYIAFYEKGIRILRDGGRLSFICANRWLKNQYGRPLRELIGLTCTLEEVIDLEEASPFEEEVIAYPAITTLRKTPGLPGGHYYQIRDIADLAGVGRQTPPVRSLDLHDAGNWFAYRHAGRQTHGPESLESIARQGFKIGIGVATGADRVFVGKDLPEQIEPELLLPVLLSRDLRNNLFAWSGHYLFNPFAAQGGLIDLAAYPRAQAYLLANQEVLSRRHVARQNPHHWYKTIDRIDPALTKQDKIMLPDMSGNTRLFIDRGQYYPHHNLYYIAGRSYDKLVLLAAILMSGFVRTQLLELGNKMNGGYPRWQSQNIRKLRVPLIDAIPPETAASLAAAYAAGDCAQIDALVWALVQAPAPVRPAPVGQMQLFEP